MPQGLGDFRKMLADPSVDVVTIATPDHWHTPMAILALAPANMFTWKNRAATIRMKANCWCERCNQYQRVLQMGAQRRSFPNLRAIIPEIHNGLDRQSLFWPRLV